MSNFLSRSVDVLGYARDGIQQHLLGAETSTAVAPVPAKALGQPFYKDANLQKAGAALAGGGVGAYFWKRHRVLGFVAGSAAGSSIPCLLKKDWRGAADVLIPDAAAIGGSLAWKKHPILGFIGGLVVGSVVEPVVEPLISKHIPA